MSINEANKSLLRTPFFYWISALIKSFLLIDIFMTCNHNTFFNVYYLKGLHGYLCKIPLFMLPYDVFQTWPYEYNEYFCLVT